MILQLSRKLDFKISTGLKDIIGRELITQPHTAVFELVKNAYDANASHVYIVFQDVKDSGGPGRGKLLVVDDGYGMSYKDIVGKWLFVGYSEKKPKSGKGDFRDKVANRKRTMAGAKGIGRFSVDRLGCKLNLYTKTPSDTHVHCLRMDWGKFEGNQNEEFQKIDVEYDKLMQFPDLGMRKLRHGTILEIFPLADMWGKTEIVKLKKYLQRLVNPMQIDGGKNFEIHMIADEFLESDRELKRKNKEHETINGKVSNIVFERIGIKTTQITCRITKSKVYTRITDKGVFVFETEERNERARYLHDININIFYLNPEAKKAFTRTMGMRSVNFGSVFLYKNGFRIHPYGEEKDDWLDLERRKGQGRTRYLSTRELIGRVEINRNQKGFREVSSRHGGVVETEEYRHLLEFIMARVIRWLERYVVEGLDWDKPEDKAKKSDEELIENSINVLAKFTNQIKDPNKRVKFNPDLVTILKEKQASDLPEVMKNLRVMISFAGSDAEKDHVQRQLMLVETIARKNANVAAAATRMLKAKEKEILFLKESQPMEAQRAGDYAHWIGIATGEITTHLMNFMKAVRKGEGVEPLITIAESISWENQRIQMVASYIGKANFDVRKITTEADIVSHIVQYVDNVASIHSKRITLACRNKNIEFNMKFAPSTVFMMIDNFVSNSRKAGAKNITIEFSVEGKSLRMLISDDGEGVANKNKEFIFQRGFTTSKTGSGVGLGHVQTIAHDMGGSVRFLGNNLPGLNSGACFEVIVNADG